LVGEGDGACADKRMPKQVALSATQVAIANTLRRKIRSRSERNVQGNSMAMVVSVRIMVDGEQETTAESRTKRFIV
jgi:hypothetical protein